VANPTDNAAIEAAVRKMLRRADARHVRVAAEYLDGKPTEHVQVSGDPNAPLKITMILGGVARAE
jgi:hypothetical protein